MPLLSVREHHQATTWEGIGGIHTKKSAPSSGKLVIYGIFCFISPLNQGFELIYTEHQLEKFSQIKKHLSIYLPDHVALTLPRTLIVCDVVLTSCIQSVTRSYGFRLMLLITYIPTNELGTL